MGLFNFGKAKSKRHPLFAEMIEHNAQTGLKLEKLIGLSKQEIQSITTAQMQECANAISAKWLHYNEVLKFKPEVSLAQIIESFAIPIREFVAKSYPVIAVGGPESFWLVVFLGIQQTGKPSLPAINAAIEELDSKLRRAT
jgi:hypothetical protein